MRALLRSGTVVALLVSAQGAGAGPIEVRATSTDMSALVAWELRVRDLERSGALRLRRAMQDTLLPGRVHERLAQHHRGVPVWGGEVVRQVRGSEVVSFFGVLHEGIEAEVEPVLGADAAARVITSRYGLEPAPRFPSELWVLPLASGDYALAWRVRVFTGSDLVEAFVDAGDGAVLFERSGLHTQAASVGAGSGVYGDAKKVSGESNGGRFLARDNLRPPRIETFDLKGNLNRTLGYLNGFFVLGDSDVASDSDNDWDDPPVVDAHVYTGYVYDYLYERFDRRGLDGRNIPIMSVVHPVNRSQVFNYPIEIVGLFYVNAFYIGGGIMVYGEGLPDGLVLFGRTWNYFSAGLDVVAHELGHGVTEFGSNLIYQDESGALNEGYSDVLAVGVEFFIEPPGVTSSPSR